MKGLFISLAILLVCAFVIIGCGTPAPTTSQTPLPNPQTATSAPPSANPAATVATSIPTSTATPQYGGILTIADSVAPGAPIGARWEGLTNSIDTQLISMEGLITCNADGSMAPLLATSWDINTSADAPSITFHLRKGVKFQDGTDFNAQAVKWNFQMYIAGKMSGATTNFWKSFDVLDDYTLRINLTEYRNTLAPVLDSYQMESPSAYQANGIAWMRDNIVGTGPFKQTDYQNDTSFTATKFSGYWDAGKPYLDGIKLLYVPDELARTNVFKAGTAQLVVATPKLAAQQLQGHGYNFISRANGPTMLVSDSLNADSPFSNVNVRQALDYAIDKVAIAKAYAYGYGAGAADQMVDPTSIAYDAAITGRQYDPAKAKQLLTDAGYPNGFKTTIMVQPGLDQDPVVAIQSYLNTVGITAALQFPQGVAWAKAVTSPVSPSNVLFYFSTGQYGNYNRDLNLYFGAPVAFYFPSLKLPSGWTDQFITSIRSPAPDPALLKKVSDAFYNDATISPIFYTANVLAASPNLQDRGLTTLGSLLGPTVDTQDAWLSK